MQSSCHIGQIANNLDIRRIGQRFFNNEELPEIIVYRTTDYLH